MSATEPRRFADLRISASAIKMMQTCGRQWAHKYLLGTGEEDTAAARVLGIGVHRALASHYTALRDGQPEPRHEDMLDVVVAAFDEAEMGKLPILFDEGETRETMIADARRLLTAFLTSGYRPRRVLGVEQPFEFPVVDPTGQQLFEERVVGVFDLVAEDDDGNLAVVDHKCWKKRSSEGIDVQMATYAAAAAQLYPAHGKPRLFHQMLLRQKVAAVETKEIPYEGEDIIEGLEAVLSSLTLAHAAIGHPAPLRLLGRRRSWVCKSCSFRSRCRGELTSIINTLQIHQAA